MKEDFKKHWKEINEQADWKELAKVYKVLNWEWATIGRVPDHKELKKTAKRLVKDVLLSGIFSLETGGLHVSWDEEIGDTLIVSFKKSLSFS